MIMKISVYQITCVDKMKMKFDRRPDISGIAQHTFGKPINGSLERPYFFPKSNDKYDINKYLTIDM